MGSHPHLIFSNLCLSISVGKILVSMADLLITKKHNPGEQIRVFFQYCWWIFFWMYILSFTQLSGVCFIWPSVNFVTPIGLWPLLPRISYDNTYGRKVHEANLIHIHFFNKHKSQGAWNPKKVPPWKKLKDPFVFLGKCIYIDNNIWWKLTTKKDLTILDKLL